MDTKEVIGGFAILEAPSMKEALELTRRFLKVHGDELDVNANSGRSPLRVRDRSVLTLGRVLARAGVARRRAKWTATA